MKSTAQGNPTEGRVYGGDLGLIHVEDGERKNVGAVMAYKLDQLMREIAEGQGRRTIAQAYGVGGEKQSLCPGCYMTVVYNMAVTLAKANGQTLAELGHTLSKAFALLGEGKIQEVEHLNVMWHDQ